jgi:hypothetical protein
MLSAYLGRSFLRPKHPEMKEMVFRVIGDQIGPRVILKCLNKSGAARNDYVAER